jgi:NMT1/THI5 like protein
MPPHLQDLRVVTVNVFPGGFNWGLYVGQDKGFFAEHGIRVEIQGTPNSVTQMTDFARGKFEIAMTAIDNIVAYVEGQGEAPIGPQPDFAAVMGSDSGFLSLVASPSISRLFRNRQGHRGDRTLPGQCRGGAKELGTAERFEGPRLYKGLPPLHCMAVRAFKPRGGDRNPAAQSSPNAGRNCSGKLRGAA